MHPQHAGSSHFLHYAPEVYLEGQATRKVSLKRNHQGPRAVLNAVIRLTDGYTAECDDLRQRPAVAESQLRDYQSRIGKPFALESYFSQLTVLRDQLKAGLAGSTPASDKDTAPTAMQIAEQIKALLAANKTDAMPERTAKRAASAAEPVTLRIRRKGAADVRYDPREEVRAPTLLRTDSPSLDARFAAALRERELEPACETGGRFR